MPAVSVTLEDINRTVLYEAYYNIIQSVAEFVKIPNGQLVISQRDMNAQLTDNRINVTSNQQDNLPTTTSVRRIQVQISEDYNEDELSPTQVNQPSAYPIFQDPDVSVSVFPIYVKSDVVFSFNYITPSKTEATRIRDDIRLRLSQTRNINLHEVEYTVLIPKVVEEFITDVYDLKNRLQPMPLEQYIGTYATKRLHLITDMANESNTRLAVKEKHIRIVGAFDFNNIPEKVEADNENGTYKVSFDYKLSLEVPTGMGFRYPVMVCNQLMPVKYLDFLEDHIKTSKEERHRNINYTSNSMYNLSIFENHRYLENQIDIDLPINVPVFDDFKKKQGHKGYGILIAFLTQVDETDLKGLFNLNDIDPYELPEILSNYIKNEGKLYITKPYESFIYLGLHQESLHFDNKILNVDGDLNVASKLPLTLMKPVRVTLSFILELDLLTPQALKRLKADKTLFLFFMEEHLKAIKNFKPQIPPKKSYKFLYDYLINIFLEAVSNGDVTYLRELVDVLERDSYHWSQLTRILTQAFPNLINELKNLAVVKYSYTTGKFVKLYELNKATYVPGSGFENTDPSGVSKYVTKTVPVGNGVMSVDEYNNAVKILRATGQNLGTDSADSKITLLPNGQVKNSATSSRSYTLEKKDHGGMKTVMGTSVLVYRQ